MCRHGAAKSVLAAADLRTLAAERGLEIDAIACGVEPDARVASALSEALQDHGLSTYTPRAVTAADVASASRVITFNLAPDEVPISDSAVERWDDVPAVSENLEAARAAIRRHLDRLIDDLSSPVEADRGPHLATRPRR